MIEDKLTREERRRLECLNLAIASSRDPDPDQIVARARQYEAYVSDPAVAATAAPRPVGPRPVGPDLIDSLFDRIRRAGA